jgi:hypothetical protein
MVGYRAVRIAAVSCCSVLAGCGSTQIHNMLGGEGIGDIRFGQTPGRIAARLERLFGRPASASAASNIGYTRGICGFDHQIVWAGLATTPNSGPSVGLTVYFKRSRFVGYSYGPPYGGPVASSVRQGPMLSTGKGLGIGDTLSRGRRLYGPAFAVTSQPQGTPPDPRLEQLPAWEARTASGWIYGFVDATGGPGSTSGRVIGSISAGGIPVTPCQ